MIGHQLEGYRFDPDGEYVRRWLPELSRLPNEWIHHPWDAPLSALRAAGVELGTNYPRPIVEIGVARERLQASLAEMWEKEAALKASLANGMEEGLGETTEVPGTGGPSHERMDVHRVVVRRFAPHSGSFPRDQLVPDLPTESQQQAAASIMHQSIPIEEDIAESTATMPPPVPSASAGMSLVGVSNPLEGHVRGLVDRSQSGQAAVPILDLDLNSTAESVVAGGRTESESGAVPIWSPSVPGQVQQQASAECLVPEVADVQQGGFSRRLTQSMLRVNQGAMASNKVGPSSSAIPQNIFECHESLELVNTVGFVGHEQHGCLSQRLWEEFTLYSLSFLSGPVACHCTNTSSFCCDISQFSVHCLNHYQTNATIGMIECFIALLISIVFCGKLFFWLLHLLV
jgi:cryptochrome 1